MLLLYSFPIFYILLTNTVSGSLVNLGDEVFVKWLVNPLPYRLAFGSDFKYSSGTGFGYQSVAVVKQLMFARG